MRTRRMWGLLGIGLLVLLIVLLPFVLRNLPLNAPTGQENPAPVAQAPAFIQDSPLPTSVEPTWTPIPTATPRPTPTLKPGPTAEPFPTQKPFLNASGNIFYSVHRDSKQTIDTLSVDPQGRPTTSIKSLPADFEPILGSSSPDGRYLVLFQPVEPAGIPYIFDQKSQEIRPLFKDSTITGIEYGWHPDSKHLLFWFFNNEELWLVDVETGEYTILAFTYGPPQGAAISPDGQKIVYGNQGKTLYDSLWIVSEAGGDAKPLLDLQAVSYVFGWSPDGKYILYMGGPGQFSKSNLSSSESAPHTLWLIDPLDQSLKPLSAPFIVGWGFEPTWSPDGQSVAFTGLDKAATFGCDAQKDKPHWAECRFQGTAIYVENVATGEVRRLTSGIEPIWSPDGSLLTYLSNQSGASEIWTIQLDGTNPQQLTTDGLQKGQIAWATKGE